MKKAEKTGGMKVTIIPAGEYSDRNEAIEKKMLVESPEGSGGSRDRFLSSPDPSSGHLW